MIHDVWAKKCDGYRLISHIPDEMSEKYKSSNSTKEIFYNNMVILEPPGMANDTYSKLTDKIYLTIQYIYNFHNDYDWYLKADDDTYIFVENLLKFVSDKDPSSPVTYGYDFKVIVPYGYHSGGGGYLLSNEALKRLGNQLNKDYSFCPNTGKVDLFIIVVNPSQSWSIELGTEDVDVGKCLRMLNVYPNKSIDEYGRERFHPLNVMDHFENWLPDWMHKYASNPIQTVTS